MYSINPVTVGKYFTVYTPWKQRSKHAQYTQYTYFNLLIETCFYSFFPSFCMSLSRLSLHMWYVTVLFPCPGATYTQGKHKAVCVDDCQQWPFIICQVSVLWGGKYTQWIMVVSVCRQNPTWQAAEGRDKIIYQEIDYHGHGKHCPSHVSRAKDLKLWGGGTWIEDIWELTWRNKRCISMWWWGEKKRHNHCVVFCCFSLLERWIHLCGNISLSVLNIRTEYGGDCNLYQTKRLCFTCQCWYA